MCIDIHCIKQYQLTVWVCGYSNYANAIQRAWFLQGLPILKKYGKLQTTCSFPDLDEVWKIKIKLRKNGKKSGIFHSLGKTLNFTVLLSRDTCYSYATVSVQVNCTVTKLFSIIIFRISLTLLTCQKMISANWKDSRYSRDLRVCF